MQLYIEYSAAIYFIYLKYIAREDIHVYSIDEAFLDVTDYHLFSDPARLEKDRRIQAAVLDIRKKFGKNAILRGMDLQSAATTPERNLQIGGHKSGEGTSFQTGNQVRK